MPFELRQHTDEFTYGYALTVHKAQGSQWDDVVLFDESLRLPRAPRALALYRADAGGGDDHGGGVGPAAFGTSPSSWA